MLVRALVSQAQYDKPMHFFLLEQAALALVPAPGFLVHACAAQPDFVGQILPREIQQHFADSAAMIGGRNEELVEIAIAFTKGEHRCDAAVVVGDVKAPAVLQFVSDADARVGQRLLGDRLEVDRGPALQPDLCDLGVLVFKI